MKLTSARLTVDREALAANYRTCQETFTGQQVAGVVKADGYGLGASTVASTLSDAGCQTFFVARVSEGIALRAILPDETIFVFDGPLAGTEADFVRHDLVPVINSAEQLHRWRDLAVGQQSNLSAAIHLDTAMSRLGFRTDEVASLYEDPTSFEGINLVLVMSHLASADSLSSGQPEAQLQEFIRVRDQMSVSGAEPIRASLSNSAGLFRSSDFHFDLARPGIALYGGHPQPDSGEPNPMLPVVKLEAPILQVRRAEPGEFVGYGASYEVDRRSTLATIAVGYADGFLRSGSNSGAVAIGGKIAPIVGRVSMDVITVDVTELANGPASIRSMLEPGEAVEIIGPNRTVDAVAADAGTIPYEILVRLGHRFERVFV